MFQHRNRGIFRAFALIVAFALGTMYAYLGANTTAVWRSRAMEMWENNGEKNSTNHPVCKPVELQGRLKVELNVSQLHELDADLPELPLGGYHKPQYCTSKEKVAIIIPFRNREEHLRIFLHHMHPLLQRQRIEYQILVIEQLDSTQPFNRAMLFNVGFLEGMKLQPFDCFIFHDVDLLPEDDRNIYDCPPSPMHMSVAVDKFNYNLIYSGQFGGVSAMRTEHFRRVNGFSNSYWGWGAEDDDMYKRIVNSSLQLIRRSKEIARYTMIKHLQQPVNSRRVQQLSQGLERFRQDGLNDVAYTVEEIRKHRLFLRIGVTLYREEDNE